MALLLITPACTPHRTVGEVGPSVERPLNAGELPEWAVLEELAGSVDVTNRRLSARVLVAHRPEEGGGEWGVRFLHDPSPYVRRAAMEALAQRVERSSDEVARGLLLESLGREELNAYTVGHLAHLLRGQLGDEQLQLLNDRWRNTPYSDEVAPLALGPAESGDAEALEALKGALAAGDLPLELTLFRDLGESGLPLGEALQEGVDRLEEELRAPAMIAAVELGHEDGERWLERALSNSSTPDEHLELLELLLDLEPSALDGAKLRLLKHAYSTASPATRAYCEVALLDVDERSVERVLEQTASMDRDLSLFAYKLLGRWWERRGGEATRTQQGALHDALVVAFNGGQLAAQLQAVEVLGLYALPNDVSRLKELLEAEDSLLRGLAAEALLRLRRRT